VSLWPILNMLIPSVERFDDFSCVQVSHHMIDSQMSMFTIIA